MGRLKTFYADSEVVKEIYTNGMHFMLPNKKEYVGYYHYYLDGSGAYTGADWDPNTSVQLIQIPRGLEAGYQSLHESIAKKFKPMRNLKSPEFYYAHPTMEEYEAGKYNRYFLSRRNKTVVELDIIEVSKDDFDSWEKVNSGIDEYLYNGIQVEWKLTGPLHDMADPLNKEIILGVADTNRRIASLKSKLMPGLARYLSDPTEFSIHSNTTNQIIKDKFGNTTTN
jgi:hypothetical protein